MLSNYKLSEFLEEKLLENNSTIRELRDFATTCGVDLTIQSGDIWVSRPGYSTAVKLDIPASDFDWRSGQIFQNIDMAADSLWKKTDGYIPAEPDPSTDPWLTNLINDIKTRNKD